MEPALPISSAPLPAPSPSDLLPSTTRLDEDLRPAAESRIAHHPTTADRLAPRQPFRHWLPWVDWVAAVDALVAPVPHRHPWWWRPWTGFDSPIGVPFDYAYRADSAAQGMKLLNPRWPWPPAWPDRWKVPGGPFGGGRARPGTHRGWLRRLWEEWGKPPPPRRWNPRPGVLDAFDRDRADSLLTARGLLMEAMRRVLVFLGPTEGHDVVTVTPPGGRTTSGWNYFLFLAQAKYLIEWIDLMLSQPAPPTPDDFAEFTASYVACMADHRTLPHV